MKSNLNHGNGLEMQLERVELLASLLGRPSLDPGRPPTSPSLYMLDVPFPVFHKKMPFFPVDIKSGKVTCRSNFFTIFCRHVKDLNTRSPTKNWNFSTRNGFITNFLTVKNENSKTKQTSTQKLYFELVFFRDLYKHTQKGTGEFRGIRTRFRFISIFRQNTDKIALFFQMKVHSWVEFFSPNFHACL